MTKAKGYSIWLMPIGEVYNTLNSLILKLSRKYSTSYFKPHVTLIGSLTGSEKGIIAKTVQLASLIHPLRIELDRVEYLNKYFRCLFIKVKETDELMEANQKARKMFGRETDPKYMPHLSLMYGNLPPQTKEEIIAEIGKEISVSFDVNSIHLFSTNGEPEDWYKVKEFMLK